MTAVSEMPSFARPGSTVPAETPRPVLWLFLAALLFIALVATNIAWLNPLPLRMPTYKPFGDLPFMWQYNLDSVVNFKTAAFFQDYLNLVPIRVERPVSPLIVNLIGEFIYSLVGLFLPGETPFLASMIAAYLVYKVVLYAAAMVLCFRLFAHFMSVPWAAASVLVLCFHRWMIGSFSVFHTGELQFVTPIFLGYMLLVVVRDEVLERATIERVIAFSVFVGVAMLARPNYSTYLAVLVVAVLYGRYLKAGVSFLAHLFPIGLYLGYVWFTGLPAYSHALELGQGLRLGLFVELPLDDAVALATTDTLGYLSGLFGFHGLWMVAAAIGGVLLFKERWRLPLIFACALLLADLLQGVASGRFAAYMTGAVWFVVVGLSGIAADRLIPRRWGMKAGVLVVAAWLAFTMTEMVNLPWLHPRDQLARSEGLDYKTQIGIDFFYVE